MPAKAVLIIISFAVFLLSSLFATATETVPKLAAVKAGSLSVSGMWLRATPPGAKAGAGYLVISNNGDEADRLVSISSDLAEKNELHEMQMEGDVMKMRPMENGVVINPGETVEFKPGGLHIMFMGLNKAFTEGETYKLKLVFEKSGKVELEMPVRIKAAENQF